MVVGSNTGVLEIRYPENGEVLATASVAGKQTTITGIAFSSDESTLYTAASDGKVYIWDLFSFTMTQIPNKLIQSQQMNILQQKIENDMPQSDKKWLELVNLFYKWHRRFDIHLSEETNRLSFGEFDIIL